MDMVHKHMRYRIEMRWTLENKIAVFIWLKYATHMPKYIVITRSCEKKLQ